MFLARLTDIIKGNYKIVKNGVVIQEGKNFQADGIIGWLEVESIEAHENYIIINIMN